MRIIEDARGTAGHDVVESLEETRWGDGALPPDLGVVQPWERRVISTRIESPTFWNDRWVRVRLRRCAVSAMSRIRGEVASVIRPAPRVIAFVLFMAHTVPSWCSPVT